MAARVPVPMRAARRETRSLRLIAVVLLATFVVPARAQESRLEARHVTMFNQSLYFGAMERPRALALDRKRQELWVADAGANRDRLADCRGRARKSCCGTATHDATPSTASCLKVRPRSS